MTDAVADAPSPTPARPRRPRPPVRRTAMIIAAAILLILLLAIALLYLNRRAAAREVLVGWLEDRGIEAEVEVERIELDGFVGRIRVGDPTNPDFSVERAEVDYAVGLPWSQTGLGVTPSRIRLVRPVLRASWLDGKFSLGSLDPLVEEFTRRPPSPDASAPLVVVEGGTLRLTTEYGAMQVLADARVEDKKLMRLSARMPAASLRSGETSASIEKASLDVTTTGDTTAVRLNATVEALNSPALSGAGGELILTADLPYPDLEARQSKGPVRLNGTLSADRLQSGGFDARGARATLVLDGSGEGWINAFRFNGTGDATLTADRLDGDDIASRAPVLRIEKGRLDVNRAPEGLRWRLDTPATASAAAIDMGDMQFAGLSLRSSALVAGGHDAAFEVSGPVRASAGRFAFGDLDLRGVDGRLNVDLTQDGAPLFTAAGSLSADRGAWPLFGPAGADDPEELKAMKAALGQFRLTAPGVRLTTGAPGTQVRLTSPARLIPANGGVLTVAPARTPIYQAEPGRPGGGALTLTAERGAGLPEARFDVPRWSLTGDGFNADLSGRAALDFALFRGLTIDGAGTLASGGGRLTFAAEDCAALTVERLELGENDALDLSGGFCPADGPLVTVRDGAWLAHGQLRDVSADVPFLGARFAQASGVLTADGGPSGIGLEADVTLARVIDAMNPVRFHPLEASGRASLAADQWNGAFDISRLGAPLGQVRLQHQGVSGVGGVMIDVPALVFSADGLQPDDLTPLVDAYIASPVEGSATFNGRFDWTAAGVTSSGVASTPGLDFTSPVGPVKGLKGSVEFTSLTPLLTAPDQRLTIDSIAAFAPLSEGGVTFELRENAARISAGSLRVGGGLVSIEPFDVPFDRDQPVTGVIVLDKVQLGDLVSATGFADKVSMNAVVSGRLPFVSDRSGVRIVGGSLAAVQPGRLSIQREALTGLEAGGGGDVPPNTVQDLAYQAMENLSFDILSAEVNSLDEGRLGVLFRIQGRHDPPEHQELRLSLSDLISREFLNRAIPLPSGTGIDLTLDTTLNANQLLSDLMELNRARQGESDPDGEQP